MAAPARPRTLRAAPDPLGSFIRPGYNDHTVLAQALTERRGSGTGIVVNPVHTDRQAPLIMEATSAGVETILDSKSLELSSPGGFALSGVAQLPWSRDGALHTPAALTGTGGTAMVRAFAETAAELQVSGVLAPSHFLADVRSAWWNVDATLTRTLRQLLDELGMQSTLIYLPVMVKASALLDDAMLTRLIGHLQTLPIDGIWLRLHPFGTASSGPLALKRYLHLCRRLHALGVPLVAEHSGSIGVALLAFGAVGGIESGVTFGDTVNVDTVLRPPRPGASGFGRPPRVYLHQLGAFLEPDVAREFFSRRGTKLAHGCQDASCCPRGWVDMVGNPRRHFLRQRAREVAALSSMPDSLRPGFYMESFLRPATDRAAKAVDLEPSLARVRTRLDSWRGTLGADLEQHAGITVSPAASGRRLRARSTG